MNEKLKDKHKLLKDILLTEMQKNNLRKTNKITYAEVFIDPKTQLNNNSSHYCENRVDEADKNNLKYLLAH